MTSEKIHELHLARPFRPFTIHLADGRKIPVHHPEFMAESPTGRIAIVFRANGTHEYIDLLLVTSVEVKANGLTKRR